MKFIRLIFIPLFIVILLGCADENPLLVNPPDGTDSMMLRVINLAGDGNARQLSFGPTSISAATEYSAVSPIFRAPIGDSATAIILNNGIEELRTFRKLQFTRTNYHTYFILPGITAKRNKPADTLLYYTTQARRSLLTRNPEIKLINCFPDSQYVFSVREGCQNGEELLRDNGYLSQSATKEITGNVNLSLTLLRTNRTNQQTDVIGLYSLNVEDFSSYCLFTYKQKSGSTGLSVINDRNQTTNALQNLAEVPERKSLIRFLNLSRSDLSLKKLEQNVGISVHNVPSTTISTSTEIGACKSSVVDTFTVEQNGERGAVISFPVQVQKTYIIIANDSTSTSGKYVTVLPQITNSSTDPLFSRIYVINLIQKHSDLTFAVASRTVQGNKQLSGEVLSSGLLYGSMSAPVILPAGTLPLTIFTTKQPAQLQSAFVGNIEGGKSYYLIAWSNVDGQTSASLLPTNAEEQPLPLLDRGSFIGLVQANSAKTSIKFSIDNILSGLNVDFRSSTGTVLKRGNYQILADDLAYNITINPDSNYTVFTYTSQSHHKVQPNMDKRNVAA